ncbi:hypothetical protein SAMN05518861_12664 [Mesorhizobium sp. YR577]|nr:hypothetical protein SAMN05518861_12664 [Mesorhizobium sp. YR577]
MKRGDRETGLGGLKYAPKRGKPSPNSNHGNFISQ